MLMELFPSLTLLSRRLKKIPPLNLRVAFHIIYGRLMMPMLAYFYYPPYMKLIFLMSKGQPLENFGSLYNELMPLRLPLRNTPSKLNF